ncbi:peroxiredoxin-like family protein [Synoicihabitans lomoniglobus]|uniref:Peroxiredoxin-like family protein n=2 Tax=Synoicihabitans lomoniglobus TaxID=2909285 RepID=A0AAF0CPT2_9BACT|nr:peroxiredoxin-like family protein [Opitutaceae bacterium LMO-M01]
MRLFFVCVILLGSVVTLPAASLPVGPENTAPAQPGTMAPAVPVQTPEGTAVDLLALVREQPTVLIVYRGGWCPFCSAHLGEIAELEPALLELGYRVVAISPERPETLKKLLMEAPTDTPHRLLYSDRAMHASMGLGLAYAMPTNLQKRYLEHGIDLAPVPESEGQHWLPVPAAFIFDREGAIAFSYANPDYRTRVDAEDLLAAARAALE